MTEHIENVPKEETDKPKRRGGRAGVKAGVERQTMPLSEANKLLGIPISTAYDLIKRDEYPAAIFRAGGLYLVNAADVSKLLTGKV